MAHYNYCIDVCHRDDFNAMVPVWEKDHERECDHNPNYDGDCWLVAEMLLDSKDAEIAKLKLQVSNLEDLVREMNHENRQ